MDGGRIITAPRRARIDADDRGPVRAEDVLQRLLAEHPSGAACRLKKADDQRSPSPCRRSSACPPHASPTHMPSGSQRHERNRDDPRPSRRVAERRPLDDLAYSTTACRRAAHADRPCTGEHFTRPLVVGGRQRHAPTLLPGCRVPRRYASSMSHVSASLMFVRPGLKRQRGEAAVDENEQVVSPARSVEHGLAIVVRSFGGNERNWNSGSPTLRQRWGAVPRIQPSVGIKWQGSPNSPDDQAYRRCLRSSV